jgi:hypothetical protein
MVNLLGWPVALEIHVAAQFDVGWVPPGRKQYLVMDLHNVIQREVESSDQVVLGVVGHRYALMWIPIHCEISPWMHTSPSLSWEGHHPLVPHSLSCHSCHNIFGENAI